MTDLAVEFPARRTDHRLGRVKVHDPRSRGFAARLTIDPASWHTHSIRVYDPAMNPNQCHGECTGVAKAIEFNAQGNRRMGAILNMDTAHTFYSGATARDPWTGAWPPDDTGSSGLAAAQTAQALGEGGAYEWDFDGADGVIQALMPTAEHPYGRVSNVGTWWYEGMFDQDSRGRIEPTGELAGGHQYVIRGYDRAKDEAIGRCWWGMGFRDFRIARTHLNELILDGGDVHRQARA